MRRARQTIQRRLSSRILLIFGGIVVATTITAGLLAYWLVRTELERQARARVASGEQVIIALIDAERARLDDLASLTAERPTLQRLLAEDDRAAINEYVVQYRSGAELDYLVIYDAAGQVIAGEDAPLLCSPSGRQQEATLCRLNGPVPQLAVLASRSITGNDPPRLHGYVTMGTALDDEFAELLAARSGLEQSILIDGRQTAGSAEAISVAAIEGLAAEAQARGAPATTTLASGGETYYAALFPLRGARDEVIGLGGVMLPVTELVRAERRILLTLVVSMALIALTGLIAAVALRDAVSAEAVQFLRSQFLASISHEFRTPLAALRASVEFLGDELETLSAAEIERLLRSIHVSVTGLQTLIDNLLESGSIEAGQFVIRPRTIELDGVVQDAAQIMQPLLARRQQELVVSLPEEDLRVHADPTRLTQVLVNLLANASKYGPMEQRIDLDVALPGDGFAHVAVADQGPGVPPAAQERLFRRFARLTPSDGAHQGVGLGLWVVRAIVTAHGGTVGMQNRPEGGATFWFTTPLAGR